jgi:ESS family glutamate:Na+ symporter
MYGFTDGGIAGLSVAAVGFGFAYIHGIQVMRWGIRSGLAQLIKSNDDLPDELRSGLYVTPPGPSAGNLTSTPEAIESLTLHWSIIGLVYGFTWLMIEGAANLLHSVGADAEINTLWSFHFIFCSVTGILARHLLEKFKGAYIIDEGLMTRTSNLLVDVMITASLAGITLAVVGQYLLPIVLTCVLASVATYYFIKKLSQLLFKEWVFERFLSSYAVMTGTIQSGLVILRVLDPHYKSTISIDLVHASGFALILGFPLLFLINAPISLFEDYLTGYFYSLMGMIFYAVVLIAGWIYFIKKTSKNK